MVQVPGLQDPQALKNLLGQTAKLEFKLVDTTALQSDIQRGIAPPGTNGQLLAGLVGGNSAAAASSDKE